MQEFKGMLYKSMEDPQIDLTSVSIWHAFSIFWQVVLVRKQTIDVDLRPRLAMDFCWILVIMILKYNLLDAY